MWNDLWAALALMFVFEGLLPFLSPQAFRRMLASVAGMEDRGVRIAGLISMLAGLALLSVVR